VQARYRTPCIAPTRNLTIAGKRIASPADGRFAINPHTKGVVFK